MAIGFTATDPEMLKGEASEGISLVARRQEASPLPGTAGELPKSYAKG